MPIVPKANKNRGIRTKNMHMSQPYIAMIQTWVKLSMQYEVLNVKIVNKTIIIRR